MSISFVWLYVFICVIVRVQMWCVCAQPHVDRPKKIFNHFICIWKCFYHSLFLSVVLNLFFNVLSLFLCWKIGVRAFCESFVSCSRLGYESQRWKNHFWHSSKNFRKYLMSSQLVKFPNQLFYGYFMSFWSKTPRMTLLWLHPLQTLFFKASTFKPN